MICLKKNLVSISENNLMNNVSPPPSSCYETRHIHSKYKSVSKQPWQPKKGWLQPALHLQMFGMGGRTPELLEQILEISNMRTSEMRGANRDCTQKHAVTMMRLKGIIRGRRSFLRLQKPPKLRPFFLKSFQVSFLYWEYLQQDQIISEGILMLTF